METCGSSFLIARIEGVPQRVSPIPVVLIISILFKEVLGLCLDINARVKSVIGKYFYYHVIQGPT